MVKRQIHPILLFWLALTGLAGAQVLYDLPAAGGNVFPGQDGRLTVDDAQIPGEDLVITGLRIPVAASGTGNADISAFIYEDSGAGPGLLLWSGTLIDNPFDAPPGFGDFKTFSWNLINTPSTLR